MARHSSATLVVALVLLCCYAGTLVEAQKGAPQQQAWSPLPQQWNPQQPKQIPQRQAWSPPPQQQKPKLPKVPSLPAQAPQQNSQSQQNRQPAAAAPWRPPKRPAQTPGQDPQQLQWDATSQQAKGGPGQQQTPADPPQNCDVAISKRVTCGGQGITASDCKAISCCFDNNGCYYGKAVTVQCTKDAHFIVVVARDATLPNIDLESITLLGSGAGCTHVDSNSAFAIFHFPTTTCGSIVMEEPGVIIYENRMSSTFELGIGEHGTITRDTSYELLFQCRYIGTSVETLVVEVNPLDNPPPPVAAYGPIHVELRVASGLCVTKGCDEADAAFSSYYVETDYPVIKVLRDPVYFEARLLFMTDPNLVLTLGRCWTTTTPNPHSLPQWDILVDGCPCQHDRYLSAVIPVGASSGLDWPSHYQRVMFQMFTFVEPNALTPLKEQVYIHCSTAVCTPGPGESCQVNCNRKYKREAQSPVQYGRNTVVSVGPLEMRQPEEGKQGQ